MDSMIRGALPLMWVMHIAGIALMYSLPVDDPVYGELIESIKNAHIALVGLVMLSMLTLVFGLPSMRELTTATLAACFGGLSILAVALWIPAGWLMVALFVLILPSSMAIYRVLRGLSPF